VAGYHESGKTATEARLKLYAPGEQLIESIAKIRELVLTSNKYCSSIAGRWCWCFINGGAIGQDLVMETLVLQQ